MIKYNVNFCTQWRSCDKTGGSMTAKHYLHYIFGKKLVYGVLKVKPTRIGSTDGTNCVIEVTWYGQLHFRSRSTKTNSPLGRLDVCISNTRREESGHTRCSSLPPNDMKTILNSVVKSSNKKFYKLNQKKLGLAEKHKGKLGHLLFLMSTR